MELSLLVLLLSAIFVLAGTIKGTVGIGFPTTCLGLMTLFIDPRLAISYVLIPMLIANAWQVFRSGETRAALKRYLPFALTLMIGVYTVFLLTVSAPDRVLLTTLGAVIVIFVLINFWNPTLRIPNRHDTKAQITGGVVAGVMGGLTSVWAPPLFVYLTARQASKAEFVRATGLLIFAGSIPLVLGYAGEGFLTLENSLISTLLIIPTLIGFALGEKIRARLSEKAFRKALLFIFLVLGLNLLRRGLL